MITSFEVYRYSLPLKRPFKVDETMLSHRDGLIIRVLLSSGLSGVGEIAPLPGYSLEDLKKAVFQIKQAGQILTGATIPTQWDEFGVFFEKEEFSLQCSSVRFGLESAFLHLLSVLQKQSPAEVLGCRSLREIPLAGLLQGTPEEIKNQVSDLLARGCRTFKLKVGSKNIPLDVKKLHLVRDIVGPEGNIRLDANQSWSLLEAVAFARSAHREGIEFIEEPVKNSADLAAFINETGFPVALDESLQGMKPDDFKFIPGVEFLVIKPTVLNGIGESLRWMKKAADENKGSVVSSCFESAAGGRMLANLAQKSSLAAGLGTYDWLSEDLLRSFCHKQSYSIDSQYLNFQWEDLDHRQLTRI